MGALLPEMERHCVSEVAAGSCKRRRAYVESPMPAFLDSESGADASSSSDSCDVASPCAGVVPATHPEDVSLSSRVGGALRAVLFDFDATLTACEELQIHRIFPEWSKCGHTAIDVAWLREKGFGGEGRIASLGAALQAIVACGAELHIVSMADRAYIVRALAILGALHFFGNRIVGWEELGGPVASKGGFVRQLMQRKAWRPDEVLFVDDQERNLQDVQGACLTYRTRGRSGLCAEELAEIARRAASGPPLKLQ